jgi:hypothetical protein
VTKVTRRATALLQHGNGAVFALRFRNSSSFGEPAIRFFWEDDMPLLAKGADAVRKLGQALRSEIHRAAIEQSRTHLERHVAERFERRKAQRADVSRLLKRSREGLVTHFLRDNPDIEKDLEQWRAARQGSGRLRIAKPQSRRRLEPWIRAGSFEWFANPPYDVEWFWPASNVQFDNPGAEYLQASADAQNGSYTVGAQTYGSQPYLAAAGVGIFFNAPAEDTMQNFGAFLNYTDGWTVTADFYSATSTLQTYLWVWGISENAWVAQTNIGPSLNEDVGWLNSNGPTTDNGTVGASVPFPAAANSQYICWVWSGGTVDSENFATFLSQAQVQLEVTVDYIGFGTS